VQMKAQLEASVGNKVDREELEELDKRKVDWAMLKSTILTLTKQNIRGYARLLAWLRRMQRLLTVPGEQIRGDGGGAHQGGRHGGGEGGV